MNIVTIFIAISIVFVLGSFVLAFFLIPRAERKT